MEHEHDLIRDGLEEKHLVGRLMYGVGSRWNGINS